MACFVYSVIGFSVFIGLINVSFTQTAQPKVTVVSTLNRPNLFVDDDGSYAGFVPDLLGLLGIDYDIKLTDKFGKLLDNGKWTGMMNELVEGNAEIAGLLTVTANRSNAVDFLYPIQTAGPTIVMKKPANDQPSLTERLTRLLEPMEFSVWLISLLALLVTGTVLYIITHFNPYEWRKMYKDREATVREAESFTCLNSFWFVISTLFWQGYVRAPRSVGARILVTAWWAFVVIFLLSYTASLTNYLRVGREPSAVKGFSKIKGFKDLVENDEMRVGVIPNGATEQSFQFSKSEVFSELYKKIIKDRTNETDFQTADELIEFIREQRYSDYAVILESTMAKYVAHQLPCNLYIVKDDYNLRTVTFAVQKGSPLRKKLSMLLKRHHEAGDIYYLESKWFKQKCESSVIRANQNQDIRLPKFYALDLGTFSAALLILVAGIILGFFVTLIEVCIFKWAESRGDDEELVTKESVGDLNQETNERLLDQEGKKGGATQV